MAPFASLKKQAKILFRLICCERKKLFQLKNKLKKMDYKRSKQGPCVRRDSVRGTGSYDG